MAVDKITPHDPRISHEHATLNGHNYHYILAVPKNDQYKATIFLIHGWPDLSMGWRYQIPFLLDQGLRVVAPDMMGYGGTDAPKVPPNNIRLYGYKQAADDMAELAKQLNAPKIILGGHDWGGWIVYRFSQLYPSLVTHVFSVCTPYMAPRDKFISTAEIVKGPLPQLGYQLQLAGPDVEAHINAPEKIRSFIKGMYGGRTSAGQAIFTPQSGLKLDALESVGDPPLMNQEEVEYYVSQYSRTGLHGPLNWYRTEESSFQDDLGLTTKTVDQPVLFIAATNDVVLKPEMSKGMEAFIPNLSRREVPSGHWALTQMPTEVNGFIREWLQDVVFGSKSSL